MEHVISGEQVFWKDGEMETDMLNSAPEHSVFFLKVVSDDAEFSAGKLEVPVVSVNTLQKKLTDSKWKRFQRGN